MSAWPFLHATCSAFRPLLAVLVMSTPCAQTSVGVWGRRAVTTLHGWEGGADTAHQRHRGGVVPSHQLQQEVDDGQLAVLTSKD